MRDASESYDARTSRIRKEQRQRALEIAAEYRDGAEDPQKVVDRAELYFKFLAG